MKLCTARPEEQDSILIIQFEGQVKVEDGRVVLHLPDPPAPPLVLDLLLRPGHGGGRDRGRQSDLRGVDGGRRAVGGGGRDGHGRGGGRQRVAGQVEGRQRAAVVGGRGGGGGRDEEGGVLVVFQVVGLGLMEEIRVLTFGIQLKLVTIPLDIGYINIMEYGFIQPNNQI